MRTAVIYSGQARTFGETFPNQYFHVLRKLPNPEFFVSVADDEQAASMLRLRERFPAESIHIEYVKQPTLPEPDGDPKWLSGYQPSATPQAILRQFWALEQAWNFYGSQRVGAFKIVVRIRPDLAFLRCEIPDLKYFRPTEVLAPWWARWGGMNDRFAIMGEPAARCYFETFHHIKMLQTKFGCPLHPETLLYTNLERAGMCILANLQTEFLTVRLDGTAVPPSITDIDLADYARDR